MLGLEREVEAESGAETQALGKEGPRELQPHWHRTSDSLAERGGRKAALASELGVGAVWAALSS
jgi:hypothetical protein